MRIMYTVGGPTMILDAEGLVSDEGFTADELEWLKHQLWLLAQTTVNERLSTIASKAENMFAALTNDTDAVVVFRRNE